MCAFDSRKPLNAVALRVARPHADTERYCLLKLSREGRATLCSRVTDGVGIEEKERDSV